MEDIPEPHRCSSCRLILARCICDRLPVVETRTRFVVVRHNSERLRGSNSARIACKCLPNSEMHSYGSLDAPLNLEELAQPGTWLLYPDENGPRVMDPLPKRVLVLDGSWSQARKMMHRLPVLRGMPHLALPPPRITPRRLRYQPDMEEGMSTMEAMAGAVEVLEGPEKAKTLLDAYDLFVEAVLRARGKW